MDRRFPTRLETENLLLERAQPVFADSMWSATELSLEQLKPWLPWTLNASLKETTTFLEGAAKRWSAGTGWCFMILRGEEVAGVIELSSYDPMLAAAEVGYWIRSDLAGKGFMTEAGRALLDFGWDQVGLYRISLLAAVGNVASNRVAQKLGFRLEGTARGASRGAFERHDAHLYGLVRDDVRPPRGTLG